MKEDLSMSNFTSSALRLKSTEHEVAVVLSHFNTDYVLEIIQNKLDSKFILSTTNIEEPNIVSSFANNFVYLQQQYPSDVANIVVVRDETYKEIINIICRNYEITCNIEDSHIDLFTQVFYLYDFFVCNFSRYMSLFFAKYIYTNRQALYAGLNLDQFKKSKDSSSAYGKKIYDDPYTGSISANLIYVINNMRQFDIPFQTILELIYGDPNIVNIFSTVGIPYDFFKTIYYSVPAEYQSILITNIRLELQQLAVADINFQNAWTELSTNN